MSSPTASSAVKGQSVSCSVKRKGERCFTRRRRRLLREEKLRIVDTLQEMGHKLFCLLGLFKVFKSASSL